MRQVLRPGAMGRPRGIWWRERWEGESGWGIHVTPWLIHVSVWQNPLQYCKVISLQLIKISEKKFFFSISLAIPKFNFLSHVRSLRLSSRHFGLVLTLNNAAACASPFSPHLLVALPASGVLFRWELLLGMYFVGFIYFPSQLGCPPRFKNFPQTHQWEGFLLFGNFLY